MFGINTTSFVVCVNAFMQRLLQLCVKINLNSWFNVKTQWDYHCTNTLYHVFMAFRTAEFGRIGVIITSVIWTNEAQALRRDVHASSGAGSGHKVSPSNVVVFIILHLTVMQKRGKLEVYCGFPIMISSRWGYMGYLPKGKAMYIESALKVKWKGWMCMQRPLLLGNSLPLS